MSTRQQPSRAAKRKAVVEETLPTDSDDAESKEDFTPPNASPSKKRKRAIVVPYLPDELVVHLFKFCVPKTLGALMAVSKHFRQVLTDENIWRLSRISSCPGSRKPSHMTELRFNALLFGKGCQVCHRPRTRKIYWSYFKRLCQQCHLSLTIRDYLLIRRWEEFFPGLSYGDGSRVVRRLVDCVPCEMDYGYSWYRVVMVADFMEILAKYRFYVMSLASAPTVLLSYLSSNSTRGNMTLTKSEPYHEAAVKLEDVQHMLVKVEVECEEADRVGTQRIETAVEVWFEQQKAYVGELRHLSVINESHQRSLTKERKNANKVVTEARIAEIASRARDLVPPVYRDLLPFYPCWSSQISIARNLSERSWLTLRDKLSSEQELALGLRQQHQVLEARRMEILGENVMYGSQWFDDHGDNDDDDQEIFYD